MTWTALVAALDDGDMFRSSVSYAPLVDATLWRGVDLKGWNSVARTSVRSHAVLEPHVRRGFD